MLFFFDLCASLHSACINGCIEEFRATFNLFILKKESIKGLQNEVFVRRFKLNQIKVFLGKENLLPFVMIIKQK